MRLVSRLDITNDYMINGLAIAGVRKSGNDKAFAQTYCNCDMYDIIY